MFGSIIDKAFHKVDRSHFMRSEHKAMAHEDRPFSIGYGQTISQPTTVRHMLTWLAAESGDKVLDVGAGSGWSCALLSYIVGVNGHVYGLERIAALREWGSENCHSYCCNNVDIFLNDNAFKLSEFSPFNRILVSASSANGIPHALQEQLAANGKLVIPVGHSIFELKKDRHGKIDYCHEHPGYVFVPLIQHDESFGI